jgi:hypothetical protein
MTNDPGRPSADQKRHCDCPRSCTCTKKNCKCDRQCTCMQTMYMLVYVPVGEKESDEEKQKGEWKIDREVITDLKGNKLSPEEIELRRQGKSRQQGRPSRAGTLGAVNGRLSSQGSATRVATPVSIKTDESAAVSASTPKSGCCHRKNIQDDRPITEVKNENPPPAQARRPRGTCNCGDNCACAMCLDHPNNPTSHSIIQRAAQFGGNVSSMRVNALDQGVHTPLEEKNLSCMGTNPQFAWHTHPDPSVADLQTIFGTDNATTHGYYLAYPVSGHSFTPAAHEASCCTSMMPSNHPELSSHQASSQFLPFVGPNSELLSPPHPHSNQDFAIPQGFPEHITSPTDFPPLLNLGGETFQPEPYVGQATVAGVYGMGNEWANFYASQRMPPLCSSTSSDLESFCNNSSVLPDFQTNAASLSNMAPPGTVKHLNATTVTPSLPSRLQTVGRSELPGYEAQYHQQPLGQDRSFKIGYNSPAIAPASTYTPELFDALPIGDDYFINMAASDHEYHSPDVGVAQTYPT